VAETRSYRVFSPHILDERSTADHILLVAYCMPRRESLTFVSLDFGRYVVSRKLAIWIAANIPRVVTSSC
jgi:hypothetical protein